MPNIATIMGSTYIGSIFKIGLLVIMLLFIIFLFVINKQIKSMNTIVTQPYLFPLLNLISWVLILLAFGLFILSIVIL